MLQCQTAEQSKNADGKWCNKMASANIPNLFFFCIIRFAFTRICRPQNTYLVSLCCFCFPPRPMRSMPCSDEGQGWISKTRKKTIAEQLPHSMVKNEIRSVIMLIALNFPCPSRVRISTTQLAKYPHVSYVEEYILNLFPFLLLEQKIMTANSKSLFLENF